MYDWGLDEAIIVDITQLSKYNYSNHSTIVKHYMKQYESSYHQATTCSGLLIFAFFFVLHSRIIVSFLLFNLVDLKIHRKDNHYFSWVQMLNWFNSFHWHLLLYPKIKSYPLQIGFRLPPNDTISFFFFFLFLFLRETIIGLELNEN